MNWVKFERLCMKEHVRVYNHVVWPWYSVPSEHLEKSGYVHDFNRYRFVHAPAEKKISRINDFGLDGLAYDTENDTYHGIQCKYWKTTDYLTAKDLGSFYQVVFNRLQKKNVKSKGFLYFTCRLQKELRHDLYNSNTIIPIYCDKEKI